MNNKELQNITSILEALHEGVYIIKDDFTVDFMNKAMVRDFGEGTGKKCYQVIGKSNEICPWCRAKEVFEGETLHWGFLYVPTVDKIYDLNEMPLTKADGTILKLSIYRDITEKKEGIEKLKELEENYRSLFENVACGVYISTKGGKFFDANHALVDMLGYETKEEFLKIDITKDLYLRPEDREKFQEMIERDGKVIDYEVEFKRKDGTSIPVLHTAHVRYDQNGKVLGYEGINVDKTQRKKIERELRQAHDFLNKVIESSPNAIIATDMKGDIIIWNHSAEENLGYKTEDVIGKMNIREIYPKGLAEKMMKMMQSPDHGGVGKLHSTETKAINSSGEEIPVEITASIVYKDNKEVATTAIFKDLRPKIETEKSLEKSRMQLLQSEKLASIGRLAAGVAHEINNPLGGIIMYSHLVLEALDKNNDSYKNLQKIVTQAERCKRIVKRLLDFSRQRELEIEPVDMNVNIEESLSFVESQALFQNIEIIKALDPNLPQIMADKSQLQQVVINLALNAAKAMGGKGKLTVSSSPGNGFVELKFTDTGCGITPENLEKIFEPFFTTQSDKNGDGLGLAVSHGIITKHKGTISVDSRVNEGTTFTIKLPVSET